MIRKLFVGISLFTLTLFALWYFLIALKPEPMPIKDIFTAYEYSNPYPTNMQMWKLAGGDFEFTFDSYDGQKVTGQIRYPKTKTNSYPVLLGVPAMGRSYVRWFAESFKGRQTVTQVNKITENAVNKGYAVIAIDPRYHGRRKDPNRTLRSIMFDMNFMGDKTDYQAMIHDTVLDYRVLLDWIDTQPELDSGNVTVAGYSMGGQIALLLSVFDHRLAKTISIVPPFVGDKVALVAPFNVVGYIEHASVLLVSANDDENSSKRQNQVLFQKIASKNKNHIQFDSGHILPKDYVAAVANWL